MIIILVAPVIPPLTNQFSGNLEYRELHTKVFVVAPVLLLNKLEAAQMSYSVRQVK